MDIFTLAIGDYVYGLAALCNSLCAAGFDGRIHVGYQGEIGCEIAAGAPIVFHELPGDGLRPTNRKAAFLLDHADGAFLYLDADIIVMSRAILDVLSEALLSGPVFCAEGIIPERDLRRVAWRRAKREAVEESASSGATTRRPTNIYFNAGLICGEMGRDRRLFSDWNQMIRHTLRPGCDDFFQTPYFPMLDQDCLNALLQDEAAAFSCIGQPDVWYAALTNMPFAVVSSFDGAILHCTGNKPWHHKLVPPRDPHLYELAWYRFLNQETPWVRCKPDLPQSVCGWLRNSRRGRIISKTKRLRARLEFFR